MAKAYIFLANGFEEIEGLTVVDILRRAQIEISMVSITGDKMVTGSHNIAVMADELFEDMNPSDGDAFILPGGMPGTRYLGQHAGLCELLKKSFSAGKLVAAICAAPTVFGALGILEGHKAICYPGMEDQLTGAEVVTMPVVVSENITTSRGMGTAIPFALSLTEQLKDKETADALGKGIVYYA